VTLRRNLMFHYELGNYLRGWFSGTFESDDEAWSLLSARFDARFLSPAGRAVVLKKGIREDKTPGVPGYQE
jgi:hypothetical protein